MLSHEFPPPSSRFKLHLPVIRVYVYEWVWDTHSHPIRGGKPVEITFTQLIIWIIIAAIVGFLGEFLAGRRAPAGILGAIMVGLFAIFLIVGFFHFHIVGEPLLEGVPLLSTIIAAAILVVIWSSIAYRR